MALQTKQRLEGNVAKSGLYLRIAAVFALVHAALHTIGGVFGKTDPGPASIAVEAMRKNQFLLMGHIRTFWDFYRGLGLSTTIFLTAEAVIFWQLALLAKADTQRLRPILATFMVAYIVLAINSYIYFFIAPTITELLVAACLGLALAAAGSDTITRDGVGASRA